MVDGTPSCLPRVCREALCVSEINGKCYLILVRREIVDPREGKETVALCPRWAVAWITVIRLEAGLVFAGMATHRKAYTQSYNSGNRQHSGSKVLLREQDHPPWKSQGGLCRDLDRRQVGVTMQTPHCAMVKSRPFRLQGLFSFSDDDVRINSPLSQTLWII